MSERPSAWYTLFSVHNLKIDEHCKLQTRPRGSDNGRPLTGPAAEACSGTGRPALGVPPLARLPHAPSALAFNSLHSAWLLLSSSPQKTPGTPRRHPEEQQQILGSTAARGAAVTTENYHKNVLRCPAVGSSPLLLVLVPKLSVNRLFLASLTRGYRVLKPSSESRPTMPRAQLLRSSRLRSPCVSPVVAGRIQTRSLLTQSYARGPSEVSPRSTLFTSPDIRRQTSRLTATIAAILHASFRFIATSLRANHW